MARGRFPSMTRLVIAARLVGLNTCTTFGCAHETKALRDEPANTMSDGSFNVLSVATTRIADRLTMLTESEMKLTTQTSSSDRKRTDTGSKPTVTLPREVNLPAVTSKTSSRLSGKLQATRVVPPGLRAIGCTGEVSQLKKLVDAWPDASATPTNKVPTPRKRDFIPTDQPCDTLASCMP